MLFPELFKLLLVLDHLFDAGSYVIFFIILFLHFALVFEAPVLHAL